MTMDVGLLVSKCSGTPTKPRQVSTSHFGFQKMTMDVGSPMSRCSRTPIKPHFQKVLFSLLVANELVLSLNIDIDDDNVKKYLNQLKF
jgi:hypothetical protein